MTSVKRCDWVGKNKPFYEEYHDTEWGRAVHDDRHLLEMLVLEGAQAGLSWETILKRREAYRSVFHNFEPTALASMTEDELEAVLQDKRIIRNRLKVYAARQNARVCLEIQKAFGSLDAYLWGFVGNRPILHAPRTLAEVPTESAESVALSNDLKKRGMSFVGPTIIYAFMQAVGMVNDHLVSCDFREDPLHRLRIKSVGETSGDLV